MGGQVRGRELNFWIEQAGEGPDVLLIGGLGDTTESWQLQFEGLSDRYRLTAFDNPGAGRTLMADKPLSVAMLADEAAALIGAVGVRSAHIAGVADGSVIAQELALRHPELVRSLVLQSTWAHQDSYLRTVDRFIRCAIESAPGEREILEAIFLFTYTDKAHNDGTVSNMITHVLEPPHQLETSTLLRFLEAFTNHNTADRLHLITAPTLVLAGNADRVTRARLGREVAGRIPCARFEIMAETAHQPFKEAPKAWNARVDAFWRQFDDDVTSEPPFNLGFRKSNVS